MAELIGIKLKRLPADDLIEWEARGSASQKRGPQRDRTTGSDMKVKDETNKSWLVSEHKGVEVDNNSHADLYYYSYKLTLKSD